MKWIKYVLLPKAALWLPVVLNVAGISRSLWSFTESHCLLLLILITPVFIIRPREVEQIPELTTFVWNFWHKMQHLCIKNTGPGAWVVAKMTFHQMSWDLWSFSHLLFTYCLFFSVTLESANRVSQIWNPVLCLIYRQVRPQSGSF